MKTLSNKQFNQITYSKGYQESVLCTLSVDDRRAYEAQSRKMDAKDAASTDAKGTY
jgi:hypothetical protein